MSRETTKKKVTMAHGLGTTYVQVTWIRTPLSYGSERLLFRIFSSGFAYRVSRFTCRSFFHREWKRTFMLLRDATNGKKHVSLKFLQRRYFFPRLFLFSTFDGCNEFFLSRVIRGVVSSSIQVSSALTVISRETTSLYRLRYESFRKEG